MRVFSPHCGLDPETNSGGETYERELLRRLPSQGVAVDILLARHKRHPVGVANWRVHRLPIGRGLHWTIAALVLPPFIKRVYDASPFDLLRVHSLRYIGPAAVIARRRYGLPVPIIGHHHHLDPSRLNRVLERRVIQACDHLIVVSEFSKRQLARELGVSVDRVSVIANGIEDTFRPAPARPDLVARYALAGRPVVMFLGGLKRRKDPNLLVTIFREVSGRRPDARFLVVGDGPLLGPMRRGVARVGLADRVVFTGYVPEAEKPSYYNLADVFVFPSRLEGFGRPVAEAMSSGLPVVASNRGALPELLAHGEGGFLCDPDRGADFVDAILCLLDDSATRVTFGDSNRARIDRSFRWDHVVRQVVRVYEETLARWRARLPARPAEPAR